jgi:hypothetical protein
MSVCSRMVILSTLQACRASVHSHKDLTFHKDVRSTEIHRAELMQPGPSAFEFETLT